jgi:PAS domain S-box-containing protein
MAADAAVTESVDARVEDALAVLNAMAALDFSKRAEIVGDGGTFDALAATINLLGEELDASHRAILSQKALLEAVLNSIGDGLIVTNPTGDVLMINAAARAVVGDPDHYSELLRMDVRARDRRTKFDPKDVPFARALRGEHVEGDVFVVTDPTLPGRDLHFVARPVVNAANTTVGALLLFRDTTERRATEASMRRLAAIVETSDDAIVSYDREAKIATWNAAAERLYGYPPEEAIGMSFARLVPDDRRDEWENDRHLVHKGRAVRRETVRLCADGRLVPVLLSAAPIVASDGKVIAVSSIAHDDTESRRLRRELQVAKEAAEAATRAKSEFLAKMSHEIRTPLTAVLGFADLLLDPKLDPSERLNYLLTLRRNGEHLLSVVNDVLDLAKIEAGELVVEKIALSPSELLNEVASLMRVRALDKGLEFVMRFDTPIPATIRSDPTRLRQILINLVGNAIKFTERGSVRMIARLEPSRSMLAIDVIDTGIGIAADQIEQLFRPFRQADPSMTRRYGGTGLGLAICRLLAGMLGGSIEVTSAPEQGSTFSLWVPVALSRNAQMVIAPSEVRETERPSPALDVAKLRGTVLLAEDGFDNQVLIGSILRRQGLEVTIADNGRIAVERAREASAAGKPFDVILMDMQMPELDGYSATAQLRTEGYRHPIIAITAHAMAGERQRCLAAGCDEYLSKPIDRALLLTTIRDYLPSPNAAPSPIYSTLADDPDMIDVIDAFVNRMPTIAEGLRAAENANDVPRLRTLLHQLKGAAGGYGFEAITLGAERAERLLIGGDLARAHAAVGALVTLCEQVRPGVAHQDELAQS